MTVALQTIAPALPILRATATAIGRSDVPQTVWQVLPSTERATALEWWRLVEQRWSQSPTLAASATVPLAASSLWTAAWLLHYGRSVPHEYLTLCDEHGPCGIALLTSGVGRGFGPLREQTRHLGTAGEPAGDSVCVEHNHLLVLPQHRTNFQEQLVTHVLKDKSWESLCLDGFTEHELTEFQKELPGFEVRSREAPHYNLRAAREAGTDLLDCLGRSTRQNVRRLLRKYGDVEVQWAENLADALDIFDELQTLHQARWQKAGQPGAFHSQRFRDFQRTLIERAWAQLSAPDASSVRGARGLPHGVVLFRARQAGETVGCLMLLIDGTRLLDYLSGFGDFDRFASPGVVTHVLCMTEALRRGFDEYDFLVGEKRHKDNLSTNSNHLVWAVWRRPTLRSRTIGMLGAVKRRWTDFRRPAATPQPAAAET